MKAQVTFAARGGRRPELLRELVSEAERACKRLSEGRMGILQRIPDDPFARFQPAMRGIDAVWELEAPGTSEAEAAWVRCIAGLGDRLAQIIHVDLSGVFAGKVNSVVPPEETPYRYLYLMRRKAGMSHAAYIDYYERVHANFGRRTPGIAGYQQLHLDAVVSRRLTTAAGLGLWAADSVSELWLPSVDGFLEALATSTIGRDGPADELNFCDRDNSVGQCLQVEWQSVAS